MFQPDRLAEPQMFEIEMGYPRQRPKQLARKLLEIRRALGLSQGQMVRRLGAEILPNCISKYEMITTNRLPMSCWSMRDWPECRWNNSSTTKSN
jgi:hypothetical protein